MASDALQYSTETSPTIEIIDPDDLKNKKSNLTPNMEEISDDESVEEVITCSSAKKKAAKRKRIMSSEEEEDDQNTLKNSEESILRARDDSETSLGSKSDAMDDEVNDLEDDTMARKHGKENTGKKERRAMILSDDKEDERTPVQSKKCRTEIGRNVRRNLALDKLKNKRDQKQKGPSSKACTAAEGSYEESQVNSLLESDKESEDEASLVGDEDYSIVPAFTMASHLLLNEDQMFELQIESLIENTEH